VLSAYPEHPAVIRAKQAEAERDVLAEALAWGVGKDKKSMFQNLPWMDAKKKWLEYATSEVQKRGEGKA
jgi:hypothetical protein